MAENSGIQWTTHTLNPWRGCTRVSEACRFCHAETLSKRNPATLGVWGPKGTRVVASESMWRLPLKWDRLAKEAGERHRVFCASLADVFEDWSGPMVGPNGHPVHLSPDGTWWRSLAGGVPCDGRPLTMDDCRARLFDLILATPHLDWLLLTKRPAIMADYLVGKSFGGMTHEWGDGWPNVWLGVTVEDQARAKERIPVLLSIPAVVHWLSCEPLFERIDIEDYLYVMHGRPPKEWPHGHVDWVIVGGESGSQARPFDLRWARDLVGQCRTIAPFVKQLGSNPFDSPLSPGHPASPLMLRDSHGGDWNEWPGDLRVRAFPAPAVIGGLTR